jgi:L-methionine (R)-S-oxide reductase
MLDSRLEKLISILGEDVIREERAKRIAETIRSGGHFRWVGIYDVDHQRGLVSVVAWSGADSPAYPVFPIYQGLTSRAIASRKTINVGDVASDADYLTALGDTRSEIIVPVLDDDGERVIGTIDVESLQADAFDPAIQTVLEKCANVLRPFWQQS